MLKWTQMVSKSGYCIYPYKRNERLAMDTEYFRERAQAVMNNADDATAELLDDLWTLLQSRDAEKASLGQVLSYWRLRADIAEMRIEKAREYLAESATESFTEKLMRENVEGCLNAGFNDREPVVPNHAQRLLALAVDNYSEIHKTAGVLVAAVSPYEIIEAVEHAGWTKNQELSNGVVATMESPSGGQVGFPLDKSSTNYGTRMMQALNEYAANRLRSDYLNEES